MNCKTAIVTLATGILALTPLFAAQQPAREAARAASFAKLYGTGDGPIQVHPLMPLSVALGAYALVADGFDESGRGDAEYWMKTTRDFGIAARAFGSAVRDAGRSMQPGPVSAAVSGLGARLLGVDWGGSGDANFWMLRATAIAQKVRDAGRLLRQVAQAAGPGDSAQSVVPAAAVIEGLGRVAACPDYSGNGDAYYWMRTTRDFAQLGRAAGRALLAVSGDGSDPLTVVLRGMSQQLTSLDDSGTGDANFWMARARGIAEQMEGNARSLHDIASNL
ncbi:MAG: hypothetical protein HY303_03130 [Candidatus Wallbacteria bacterium]|nr:hypothetical protein [Candidatus Wallbacteria bacterium]